MLARPLAGRVAVVSGANHGIGAATAVRLGQLGADVAVTYLRSTPSIDDPSQPETYRQQREQGPESVLAALAAAGLRGHAIEADLTEADAPARIFAEVEEVLGPVSVLVNNASGWRRDTYAANPSDPSGRHPDEVSAATATTQLMVDARGGALMIAQLATSVRRNHLDGGRIISLTSGGPMGFPGEVSYGAAKAALENSTMSAALELAGDGITANVVYPPVTDTGWITEAVRAFVDASPDHFHVALPEDVAEVIGWLCTDEARLVTGNVIRLR